MDGTLNYEMDLKYAIPYRCPARKSFEMAVGDVNGDNFEDLVIGTCRGEVYIFSGVDITYKVAEPRFSKFRPYRGNRNTKISVAVGYNVPGTIPSATGNLITTPNRGKYRGIVEVWGTQDPRTYTYSIDMVEDFSFNFFSLVSYTPFPLVNRRGRTRRAKAVDIQSSYYQNTTNAAAQPVIYASESKHDPTEPKTFAITTFGSESPRNNATISYNSQYITVSGGVAV
jgi:hypothetical protein